MHGHEGFEFGGLVGVIHVAVLFLSRSDRASFFTFGSSAVRNPGVVSVLAPVSYSGFLVVSRTSS